MLTYGDGVGNIDISVLLEFHRSNGKIITMTSVQPEGRFGSLILNANNEVLKFQEKIKGDGQWVNAGFFVCEPEVLNYLKDDSTILEKEPLEKLADEKQLVTFKHNGFWKPMDTLRDKRLLEELIASDKAPGWCGTKFPLRLVINNKVYSIRNHHV